MQWTDALETVNASVASPEIICPTVVTLQDNEEILDAAAQLASSNTLTIVHLQVVCVPLSIHAASGVVCIRSTSLPAQHTRC